MKNSSAYSRGKQVHHSMGTLNPNLNIEDEYVENLLKQIQFLSLETKLIKENHSQSKGFGIMALIDKENLPVVDHLLASAEKYKQMRSMLSQKANQMMFQNMELEAEERGLMKKREYHDSKRKSAAQVNAEHKGKTEAMLKELEEKMTSAKTKWEEARKANQRLRKATKDKESELEKLLDTNLIGNILGLALTMKSDSEYKLEQEDLVLKTAAMKGIADDITKYKDELSKHVRYLELSEENAKLTKDLEDQQRLLSSLQFRIVEVETVTKLAQTAKEKEIKQRRTTEEHLYTTKQLLEEVIASNEIKIEKRRVDRVKNSAEIKKMETMVQRLEEQFQDARAKYEKADDTHNKYSIQQKSSLETIAKLSNRVQEMKDSLTKLTGLNSQMQDDSLILNREIDLLQREITSLRKDNDKLNSAVLEVEEVFTEAHERNEFYESNNRLKEELKSVKLEQLCGVMENNLDVNKTVSALIAKWKDIQEFSRS